MKKYVSEETLQKRKKRRKRKRNLRILTLLLFVGVVSFAGYHIISGFFSSDNGDMPNIITPSDDSILQTNTEINLLKEGEVPTINLSYNAFDFRMVQVQESDLVPLSYFDDAVFVGDSLADGFRVYRETTEITNATFITAKNTSPKSYLDGGYINVTDETGASVPVVGFEAIAASNPGKVYITMGTNALNSNMSEDDFMATYYQFIDELRLYLPETQIYVTSILPIAAYKIDAHPGLEPVRVFNVNTRIAQMCYEKDLAFINLYEVFKSASGYLREDIAASDGIHLTPSGYSEWANYLRTHTVYNTSNPALVQ